MPKPGTRTAVVLWVETSAGWRWLMDDGRNGWTPVEPLFTEDWEEVTSWLDEASP